MLTPMEYQERATPATKALAERPPVTHELKCHPGPYRATKSGDKPFEFRKDDRDYRVGDTLWLREWDPQQCNLGVGEKAPAYTGDEIHRLVTYIIREGFGIPNGYCIMGLSDLERHGLELESLNTDSHEPIK